MGKAHRIIQRPQPSPSILAFRRSELERWIEHAIALLDAIDGDPDIEANGDEHDVGFPESHAPTAGSSWCGRQSFPLEDDEENGDAETDEDAWPNPGACKRNSRAPRVMRGGSL